MCKQNKKQTILILNWIVWNFNQNDLIRRYMTRKGLIHRKTKQSTNQHIYLQIHCADTHFVTHVFTLFIRLFVQCILLIFSNEIISLLNLTDYVSSVLLLLSRISVRTPCHVVANVLDCNFVLSKFELQSRYNVHFRTNTLGKYIESLVPSDRLNCSTAVLQRWLCC